jgi:type IV pilus assembly protein PilQ
MNRRQLLLTVATLGVLVSCSGGPKVTSTQPEAPALPGGPTLREVEPVVAEDRTRLVVRADYPLNYTSYAPDAATLVVELPNANGSLLPSSEVPVASADIETVRVERFEDAFGSPTTRLVIIAAPGFRHEVRSQGSELHVEVMGPQRGDTVAGTAEAQPQEPAAEPAAPGSIEEELALEPSAPVATQEGDAELELLPEEAQPEPVAEAAPTPVEPTRPIVEAAKLPPATALTRVRIQDGGASPRVVLEGDGALQYESFMLSNPARLVVDLKQANNQFRQPRLSASGPLLSAVRVAQFKTGAQPVSRVVFDLQRPAPFQVIPAGRTLEVVLGEAAAHAPAPVAPKPEPLLAAAEPVAAPAAQEPQALEPLDAEAPAAVAMEEETPALDAEPAAVEEASPAPVVAREDAESAEPAEGAAEAPAEYVDSEAEFVPFEEAPKEAAPAAVASTAPRRGKVTDIRLTSSAFEAKTIAGGAKHYTGKRISISFRDADLKDVFRLFHEISGLNIVLDPGVAGKITIILDNVPWDQALDIILKNNGLDKVYEDNLIRIATTQRLAQEAAARKALIEAQELEVEPVTFTRVLSYAKADQVLPVIKKVLSKRGDVVHDARTNSLIISDVPQKKEAANRLIDTLDTRTPQVMIEARIVETDRNYEQDFGIKWGFSADATAAKGTQTGLNFPRNITADYDVSLAAPASVSDLALTFGNVLDSFKLDVTLSAFELNGSVRILSSPKVATQNNEKAVIEQGVQIPVVNTTATEINVEFISASLKLEVTPQITADDTVVLDVRIDNSSPDFVNRVGDVPPIITERAQTKILVKNGSTAVIGGIFKLNDAVTETGVPGLRKLPLLGWLFRNKSVIRDNKELLVFLTPRVL